MADSGTSERESDELPSRRQYVPLIYGLRDNTRYAYHYTRVATAQRHILRNRTLRLGHFARTNDPRESSEWQFNAAAFSRSADLSDYATDDVSRWMCDAIQRRARVACFCSDAALTGDHIADIHSRGFARPRMWAQYADDHKGVCLVFDRSKLFQSLSTVIKNSSSGVFAAEDVVTYRDQQLTPPLHENAFTLTVEHFQALGKERYALHHAMRWWQPLFFEKALDWRDEMEWRMLALVTTEEPVDVNFGDALVGVIHGYRMLPRSSRMIINLSDDPAIEHMGLTWKNGCPWYDIGGRLWSYHDRHLINANESRIRRQRNRAAERASGRNRSM